ncbi:MAG: HAD family hydrolase [Muribaculaceae bacterium]|nr:HAD family hydrolase [Muribaculaceae bacterium]
MKKQLVIFDLDGTLLNTIDDLGCAVNYAMRVNGYPEHNMASYRYMVGNGVNKLLERALPDGERDEANVKRVRKDFGEYYGKHCADHTVPYPGVEDLLDELTRIGVKVAVASNKYQEAVTYLVTKYFPHIPWVAIHGMREGVPGKPDPSIVFNILASVPTPKEAVLYVGDSGVDMETARRACVESVGVTWGFRPQKELEEYNAENIVLDPAAVIRIVNRE